MSVGNQSSALPTVDIEVQIDGRTVIKDEFSIGMGHSSFEKVLDLSLGPHRIHALSKKGGAEYDGTIDIKSEHWATLHYWYHPEGQVGDAIKKSLRLHVSDTPLRMR